MPTTEDSTVGGPGGCRTRTTPYGLVAAAGLGLFWHFVGPGPMFEEHFVAIFFALWFLAVTGIWARIAKKYGYAFWQGDPFGSAGRITFWMYVILLFTNCLSTAVLGPSRRAGKHPRSPDPS